MSATTVQAKEEKVLSDNGMNRLVATVDSGRIELKQETNGKVTGEISLSQDELQSAIAFMERSRKRSDSFAASKANQERTREEQDAFILDIAKSYGSDTERWTKLSDFHVVEPMNGRDEDNSFHYHYHAFIPEVDKVIVLTFRLLGGDSYGDRIFTSRSYYRYGEHASYTHKTGGITPKGKFAGVLTEIVERFKVEKEPGFDPKKIR